MRQSVIILLTCTALVFGSSEVTADRSVVINNLRCEYRVNPLAVNTVNPRLSWILESQKRGERQTAYRILVAGSEAKLAANKGDLWDTGKVNSDQSIHVLYAGRGLSSRMQCYWKVRVWDKDGKESGWSRPAIWKMGLLEDTDWKGKWITIGQRQNQDAAPMLRSEFTINKPVEQAYIYVCGLGYYELYINGGKIGDNVLDPAQTDYEQRVFYIPYNVTDKLKQSHNAIGVILGDGWYNQNKVWQKGKHKVEGGTVYGRPKVLLQLEITYTDGSIETVVTDEKWKAATGPIVANNVYAGESYDARLERLGWAGAGLDDSDWSNAVLIDAPGGKLVSQALPAIKRIKTIQPIGIAKPKPGVYVYDMGQNFAGWARLKVKASAGTAIKLRFAEVLAPDGSIDPASTGPDATGVVQTDIYVCKGDGTEIWEPRFTYHGFRYVEMTGFAGKPSLDNLEGIVVHTAVEPAGHFQCSDEMLNRIHQAAIWTQVSNLHGVPTDCPARERCGWLGDTHVAAEMSIYNFDMALFWTKYIGDINTAASGQYQTTRYGTGFHIRHIGTKQAGIPTMIAPGRRGRAEASPDWGTATVQLPWYIYLYYGDEYILRRHYSSMKQWADHLNNLAENGIVSQGLGDWCPPGGNSKMECPIPLTSTAYYYFDVKILADTAEILGKTDDAANYRNLAADIRTAFINRFFDAEQATYGCQTADAFALYLALVPKGRGAAIADRLARNVVEKHDGHLSTGIHGLRHLFWALSLYGHDDVAYRVLTQTTFPGFADMFARGATTLWETMMPPRSDGRLPDGSHNHPMQGGFDAWFYSGIAGINPMPESPGFKHVALYPNLINQLQWADASYRSIYGLIESRWQNEDGNFQWYITIPPNTTATVLVPAADVETITESGVPAAKAEGVRFRGMEYNCATFSVEAGRYRFVSKVPEVKK